MPIKENNSSKKPPAMGSAAKRALMKYGPSLVGLAASSFIGPLGQVLGDKVGDKLSNPTPNGDEKKPSRNYLSPNQRRDPEPNKELDKKELETFKNLSQNFINKYSKSHPESPQVKPPQNSKRGDQSKEMTPKDKKAQNLIQNYKNKDVERPVNKAAADRLLNKLRQQNKTKPKPRKVTQ